MDVLSAMCQPELPLTVHEYEEWGDPQQAEQLEQVRAGKRAVSRAVPVLHAVEAGQLWQIECL